jgi:hypothetical protein
MCGAVNKSAYRIGSVYVERGDGGPTALSRELCSECYMSVLDYMNHGPEFSGDKE